MNLVLAFLSKLPWRIIGPVAVVFALGLCVRHTVQANVRADAYARVASMTAKFSHQQEVQRQAMAKAAEDSIMHLGLKVVRAQVSADHFNEVAKTQAATLRAQVQGEQRVLLDSLEYNHSMALAAKDSVIDLYKGIITQRTQELSEANERVAGLERENATVREMLKATKGGSSTGWKIATAVATAAGIVAYAAK